MCYRHLSILFAVLAFGLCPNNAPSQSNGGDNNGLVAHYDFEDFEGTVVDRSGNGNDCTVEGSPESTEGRVGQAIKFNNDRDTLNCGTAIHELETFSYAGWVKFKDLQNTYNSLFTYTGWGLYIGKNGALRGWITHTGQGAQSDSRAGGVPEDRWVHVVLTFDGAGDHIIRLYLNGTEMDYNIQKAGVGSVRKMNLPFEIATRTALRGFHGEVDEVKIFNKVLALEEVLAMAEEGMAPVREDGLVAHYNFEEVGSGVKDQVGSNDCAVFGNASGTEGKFGQAVLFEGDGDYLECAPSLRTTDMKQFTYAAWVYSDNWDARRYSQIIGKSDFWGMRGLYHSYQILRGYVVGNAQSDALGNVLENGKWIHLAMTYDNFGDKKVRLYINGEEIPYTRQIPESQGLRSDLGKSFMISHKMRGRGFVGKIDEMRIYNKALTPEEIQESMKPPAGSAVSVGKKIAKLEYSIRTFESFEDAEGSLLVWGSFDRLNVARIDYAGNVLMAPRELSKFEDRLTGIAKPVAFQGGWFIAVRTTDIHHIDTIHAIHLNGDGTIAGQKIWLDQFERITLPVLFDEGTKIAAFYYGSGNSEGNLYRTDVKRFDRLIVGGRLRNFDEKTKYPSLLQGVRFDDEYALLLLHRSKNPPPMKLYFFNKSSGSIRRESDIPHEGRILKLSNPHLQKVGEEIKVAWYESVLRSIAPRLVVASFSSSEDLDRIAIPFRYFGEYPTGHLNMEDTSLSGFYHPWARGLMGTELVLFHVRVDLDSPHEVSTSLLKLKPSSSAHSVRARLLRYFPENQIGLVEAGTELAFVDVEVGEGLNRNATLNEKNTVEEYKECSQQENRLLKECREIVLDKFHEDDAL